ncbi:hypothetical protein BU23DRAFT_598553 [Bimuria novae-zelandiae CBS 107.79]|uniref:Uncharacterized protein n=1 Tax=Bimuria novae-zelandiae CBS 107.79 TaxID=1447943 RepID=A0A6A5VAT4_9PLEO|nr:hypothetical protein BU23DRAFT_598553 [Bimuria novae-zelandiae CBS 107.79]
MMPHDASDAPAMSEIVVQELIGRGADVKDRDAQGCTLVVVNNKFILFPIDDLKLDIHARDNVGRSSVAVATRALDQTWHRTSDNDYSRRVVKKNMAALILGGVPLNEPDDCGKPVLVNWVDDITDLFHPWQRQSKQFYPRPSEENIAWLAQFRELNWDVGHAIMGQLDRKKWDDSEEAKQKARDYLEKMRKKYVTPRKCLGPRFCRRYDLIGSNCEHEGCIMYTHTVVDPVTDLVHDVLIARGSTTEAGSGLDMVVHGQHAIRRITARDHGKTQSKSGVADVCQSRPALLTRFCPEVNVG